jgi:hypothetical protein
MSVIDEDINNRSARIHRLNKLRMHNGGEGGGVCRHRCPICNLIKKGELRLKRHGLRPRRSWKNNKVSAQHLSK